MSFRLRRMPLQMVVRRTASWVVAVIAMPCAPALASGQDAGGAPRRERESTHPPPQAFSRPETCSTELQAQLRLSGTIYDDHHPERSFAILGRSNTRTAAVYRCGSRWGSLQILEVHPRAVLLDSDANAPCWLRMTRNVRNVAPPARPSRTTPTRPPSLRRGAFSSTELEQSIQKLAAQLYRVDRSLLARAISRAGQISRSTRTRIITQRGAPAGLMLTRISSRGLFEHLGLQRGDMLKTVNGFQVASVDGMLAAKSQLSSAPRLSLSLVRAGRPMTIEYQMH